MGSTTDRCDFDEGVVGSAVDVGSLESVAYAAVWAPDPTRLAYLVEKLSRFLN